MSLKTMHLFFIILSILLTIGFGIWGIMQYVQLGTLLYLVLGIISIVIALLLLVYLRSFLKKFKDIGYL